MEAIQTATEEQAPAAAIETKPPGVIEQAMAGLRSKAALNQEIHALRTDLAAAQARVSELETQAATLTEQVTAFTADQARLEQALTEAAEEKQTVDEAAAAKIAAIGIAPAMLPAAGQDAQETSEALREKLKTERDSKERFRIQARIEALDSANA